MSFDKGKLYNVATINAYDEKYLITSIVESFKRWVFLRVQTSIEETKNMANSFMINAIIISIIPACIAIVFNIILSLKVAAKRVKYAQRIRIKSTYALWIGRAPMLALLLN